MTRNLLFVGGGIETLPGISLAQSMGLRVLVSDRNPKAPCMQVADRALIADTYDGAATIQALKEADERPNGVLCLGTDVPLTVALVAEAFGLPGVSPATAHMAMDKLAMKDRFKERGVPIPWYAPIPSSENLMACLDRVGGPLVVKPVDSRGARGVTRLTNKDDAAWAYTYARGFSPTQRVMAERYLPGPQISTESLVVNGTVYTPGFSDRNYALLERYAPFFIEDGGDLPGHLPATMQQQVKNLAAQAALALGVTNGVVKGDLVVSDGQPHVIEIATRLSGGYFCTHTIPKCTGVELVRYAIHQAMGQPIHEAALIPTQQQPVCQRYLFPKPGRITRIEGVEAVRQNPDVFYLEMRVAVGETIAPIENHPGRAGVLMTTGLTPEAARATAEQAVNTIRITTV